MLTLYPSNKLEHLSYLLNAVIHKSEESALASKIILVESTGMQHWLNMQIAHHSGIAMNLAFPMPTRFVWQLCRDVLGDDKVPLQSPYKREVMQWRIEEILASSAFLAQGFEANLETYWQAQDSKTAELKRVELARLIADTFEQYLMFRPQWLLTWEEGESIASSKLSDKVTSNVLKHEHWQRWIWLALVKQEPNHPVRLQKKAVEALASNKHKLPKEIHFFAINTMAPQTLDFFNQVAKYSHIHFYHLNPCIDYWGDASSDKAIAARLKQGQIDAWVEQQNINPLLRNLGEQGKDLFNLLSNASNYEISAFDVDYPFSATGMNHLHQVQSQILHGDKGEHNPLKIENELASDTVQNIDNSIVLRSCHSPLREVQVLHDFLLAKMAEDSTLSPQDILVMCPAIEDYSPYIGAIFGKGVKELNRHENKKIPCSIADRTALDAEPLIAAYMQLLSLPDSRFSVVELMSFLQLPAVMSKFQIQASDLDLFEHWIEQSNIFWGLNEQHRQAVVGSKEQGAFYTWEWGLSRILEGFVHADNTSILADGCVPVNLLEGQSALVLGKLIQVIEKLAQYRQTLTRARTMDEWKAYLLALKDAIFSAADESGNDTYALHLLSQTLGQFFEHVDMAKLYETNETIDKKWSYLSVRSALKQSFGSPDSRNHFMTGQVTFCSMMPMRSIPFKVIAILGLNDDGFPRKNSQIDIDLIPQMGRKIGDRSRRGDDRYLFLEAILSARETLYLSYQGRSVKDNKVKEPSLVLSEFTDYISEQFGENVGRFEQQSLHPFSSANFAVEPKSSVQKSYDAGWYRMMKFIHRDKAEASEERQSVEQNSSSLSIDEKPLSVDLADLVRFYKDPIKAYANQVEGLYLDDVEPKVLDVEPFVVSPLDKYSVIHYCTEEINKLNAQKSVEYVGDTSSIELLQQRLLGSGDIPKDEVNSATLSEWISQSHVLAANLQDYWPLEQKSGQLALSKAELSYHFQTANNTVLGFHTSNRKLKSLFEIWCQYLCCVADSDASYNSAFFNLEAAKGEVVCRLTRFKPLAKAQAQAQLEQLIKYYQKGMQEPVLVIPELAENVIKKISKATSFDPYSADAEEYAGQALMLKRWEDIFTSTYMPPRFVSSPYFQHYFKTVPDFSVQNLQGLLACFQTLSASTEMISAPIQQADLSSMDSFATEDKK